MYIQKLDTLKLQYDQLKVGKLALLQLINMAEITESVYNSNAIENSTLTLSETQKILIDMEISRGTTVREVFEAKNLAKVIEFIHKKVEPSNDSFALLPKLELDMILLFHQILLNNINDDWAGRWRKSGEYVKVSTHVAPSPESLQMLLNTLKLLYRYY
jgi:Fic family protein